MANSSGNSGKRFLHKAASIVTSFALLAALSVSDSGPAAGHGGIPTGFEDVAAASVLQPTDLSWTPDGRMIVTSKLGTVHIVDAGGTLVSTPAIDLSAIMCTNVERGLGGVTVHPEFGVTNNWIYLYFTFNKYGTCNEFTPDSPVNRLSRFELTSANTIDPASELVMLDTPYLRRWHHNAGDLEFGPDGYLYATIGDGGHKHEADEVDFLTGKIVRLTDDGDIPPGNAFSGPNSVRCNVDGVPPVGSPIDAECQEIYTLGHRNPFRFAKDPNSATTRFFVLDVGQDVWESIDELTVAGVDYGWPSREGPCAFGSNTNCAPAAGKTDPIHWYEHPNGGGAAITGGAFVPNGVWPAEYDGLFLYSDFVAGHIFRMDPGGADCRLCTPPTSAYQHNEFAEASSVVEMAFGPHGATQALYYLDRGQNQVRRIAYVGNANRTPTALATATPPFGSLPLSVSFDGTGSSDPDLDTLTYEWNFDDGSALSTLPTPSHNFTIAGVYDVTLTVDDGNGATAFTNIRIDAGNLPPVPIIISPAPTDEFAVGEVLTLTGSATDPEDGTLTDLDLSWEVRQHHNVHFHPFLNSTVGNNLNVTAPPPEDLPSTTNSNIEIRLTATDSWGQSTTVSEFVDPRLVSATFETVPAGLDVVVAGETVTTPATLTMWENWTLPISAPDQASGSLPYAWTSWSSGGSQSRDLTVGPTQLTHTANFSQTARIIPGTASTVEGDNGTTTLDVPVTLTVPSNLTVTADWTTFDYSAAAASDYVAASGTVTFNPGDDEQTVSITIIGDGTHEPDEDFFVHFSNPANALIGGMFGLAAAGIDNDDSVPTISPSGVLISPEGDIGTTVAHLPVNLSNPSSTSITLDYESVDSLSDPTVAISGIDYVGPLSGTITFAPGQTTQTVEVEVIGDTLDEPPTLWGEWGFLAFSNPSPNATLDTSFFGLGLLIIIDDD
ncbi:MAG: glucose/arabinose dehydrogenase/PKD repeat protein [Candidatus Aldehydirespiratoraceae bacterium]|jgi:glucose/arabinose dehydrogenase/PKD repeat protein